MRTKILTAAFAAAAVLAAAGCTGASSDSSSGGGTAAGGSGSGTVKWWMVTQNADSGTAALKKTIDDFNAANPDTQVTVEYRAVDALKDALRTSAGTSAGPDIYYNWAGPGLGGELVKSGVSADLSSFYSQYGWANRFNPGTLTSYTQYGGYQGVPWTQRGEVVYYNKKLFQQAGINAAPTTYDDLVAAAGKLKAAGITAMSMGGKENWHVMRLLDSLIETNCGSEKGDALNTRKASWAGEACVNKSFEQLKTWGDNYFNTGFAGVAQSEAAQLFFTGKSAMEIEGDWFTQQAVDAGMNIDDVGVFVFPTGTNRLYGFTEGQYITKSSQNPAGAAKFLDYLTSTKVATDIGKNFAATSVDKGVTFGGDANAVQTQMAQIISGAKGYYLNNDQNFPLDVTTEYWRIQNSVLAGSIAPDDAGKQLQSFIDSHKS